jgi:hypothetical protein
MRERKEEGGTMPNKDILTIDDSDGKLHLYIAAAFHGERWAAQLIFPEDKMTEKEFKRLGEFLVKATAKPLLRAKIISE